MEMDIITNAVSETCHIYLHNFGEDRCYAGQFFPPAVRDFYLLHYVADGKGCFFDGETNHYLQGGQLFLITPGVLTSYVADLASPWHYFWLGFSGEHVGAYLEQLGIGRDTPVLSIGQNKTIPQYVQRMISTEHTNVYGVHYKLQGLFQQLLGDLLSATSHAMPPLKSDSTIDRIVQDASQYLINHFSDPHLSIAALAEHYRFDRSYFSRIFKDKYDISPHRYLLALRMRKAKELLLLTDLSVTQIASAVGYTDYAVFSKVFKAKERCSPRQMRTYKEFFFRHPVGELPPELEEKNKK